MKERGENTELIETELDKELSTWTHQERKGHERMRMSRVIDRSKALDGRARA